MTVKNSDISNNTAGIRGGGIFTAGPLTTTFSQITNNSAEYGGGLYVFQEFYTIEPIVTANNNIITGNNAPEGSIVYYFLLTYVKSDYENNYWGDINPNSTNWIEEFMTRKYTDSAPKTWLEEPPQYLAESTTSKNESNREKTNILHQNSTKENAKTDMKIDKSLSFNQHSTNEKTISNRWAEKSADSISGYGVNSKSTSYLTKKNSIINQINPTNNANLILIILILAILAYGVYRFKRSNI